MKPLVPRCPHDKGQAGVTPHGLCRDCPAPSEDSVAANKTANQQKRSADSGAVGPRRAHCEVICGARKHYFVQQPATRWHDGQITQNLSSPSHKNIPLNVPRKSAA
jgi:hypothetical protein